MNIPWKTCFRVGVTALLVFICLSFFDPFMNLLSAFFSALTPLFIGLFLAYILNILMSFYERHYFPKSTKKFINKSRGIVCLILAILTFLAIIALVIGLVVPELISCVKFIISEIPPLIEDILKRDWVKSILTPDTLTKLSNINWQEYITKAVAFITSGIGDTVSVVISAVSSIISGIATTFIGIIFTIYLLLGRDKLKNQSKRVLKCYLRPTWYDKLMHWFSVINDCFHRYIVGQCTEAVILGILCMLGMFVMQIPYAAMIGTLIGFTALIPVAGAYIGAAVGAIMILTVSPGKALLFLIYLVALQQFEGNIIYPKVVGSSIGLPAIWVLAAVTIGGSLMGVMGMLIGVPIVACFYKLFREALIKRESKKIVKPKKEEKTNG